MKRMLFLGGIMQQIPAIKRARELGYYVITCDYLPENPGHKFADEYHNVSTTDLEAVLALARELKIDGIVAYASDPAAPTAAYVAEKLGLPGNPYESVKLLTEKDLFRDFLATHGFNCPGHRGYSTKDEALADLVGSAPRADRTAPALRYPLMVKPVDSSGSKGVVKVLSPDDLPAAIEEAFSYSRGHRIVVEEFIVKKGYQVSGDGFSEDGKLVFTSYGNELYSGNGTREYVALGEFWPSVLTPEQKGKVDAELQRLITALGMKTCAYNIEVILDKDDNVYILELGPRNGGSYIPQLIQYATGVDMVTATLQAAMGDPFLLKCIGRRELAERKVEEWLAGVDESSFEKALRILVEGKRVIGEYQFEHLEDIERSIVAAKAFFNGYSRRIVELSDGRFVYFAPDPRSRMRNPDNSACWAEYAFHAVSSGGDRIPGKTYNFRKYNEYKVVNTDLIESTLRSERCVPVLRDKPAQDSVKFFGAAHLGGLFDVVVRLDEYGNVNANMTEVTFEVSAKRGQKKSPQLVSLTEAIRTVVSHQTATGTYPSNDGSIAQPSESGKGAAGWTFPLVSNYMIYSTRAGTFSRLVFDPAFERDNLLEVHCTAKPGDTVHAYQNTSHSLGTILFKAKSFDEMSEMTANIEKYYEVVVNGSL